MGCFFLQLTHLKGIRYIYTENIFFYLFFAFIGVTLAWVAVRGRRIYKKRTLEDIYAGR